MHVLRSWHMHSNSRGVPNAGCSPGYSHRRQNGYFKVSIPRRIIGACGLPTLCFPRAVRRLIPSFGRSLSLKGPLVILGKFGVSLAFFSRKWHIFWFSYRFLICIKWIKLFFNVRILNFGGQKHGLFSFAWFFGNKRISVSTMLPCGRPRPWKIVIFWK